MTDLKNSASDESKGGTARTKPHPSGMKSGSPGRMYLVVVGVGIVSALAIAIVYESTKSAIDQNAVDLRHEAILDVLPKARTTVAFRRTETGAFEPASPDSSEPNLVFAGYDANRELVGVAIEAEGMGYQDLVRVLYGYSFEQQAIVGMRVLQSRETPGLGDRVETDPDFLRNFEALDVRVDTETGELVHVIEFVKPGAKESGWQIDGISGATITSRTIAVMLSQSTRELIPQVVSRRSDFEHTDARQPH